jgi:phosphoenolpyruvate carboxykinase (ATP)
MWMRPGELANVEYKETPIFGLHVPVTVSDVPAEILEPSTQWADANDFNSTLVHLATIFKVGPSLCTHWP